MKTLAHLPAQSLRLSPRAHRLRHRVGASRKPRLLAGRTPKRTTRRCGLAGRRQEAAPAGWGLPPLQGLSWDRFWCRQWLDPADASGSCPVQSGCGWCRAVLLGVPWRAASLGGVKVSPDGWAHRAHPHPGLSSDPLWAPRCEALAHPFVSTWGAACLQDEPLAFSFSQG